ncbi:hypothetical protein SAMN05216533_4740 [Streptomyces sp. Ag109_O5-10]|nr:hypothetical protein SAMN05216533_4740 [Streptomyces sp. Ag109_O5-10]
MRSEGTARARWGLVAQFPAPLKGRCNYCTST